MYVKAQKVCHDQQEDCIYTLKLRAKIKEKSSPLSHWPDNEASEDGKKKTFLKATSHGNDTGKWKVTLKMDCTRFKACSCWNTTRA